MYDILNLHLAIICMVNVGESPYIEHLRMKNLQEVPGGGNHFEPPFFPYILLATILSTFSTSIGYVLVGTKALGFTTHAIYR